MVLDRPHGLNESVKAEETLRAATAKNHAHMPFYFIRLLEAAKPHWLHLHPPIFMLTQIHTIIQKPAVTHDRKKWSKWLVPFLLMSTCLSQELQNPVAS